MEIKTPFIWKNGELRDWDDTTDHNLTHTLHYGWWVFEWIRFYNTENGPKIFRLKEHIERFFYSASVLNLDINYSIEEIMNACIETVAASWVNTGYIRPIAYYGYGKMGLYPEGAKVETVISVWKWGKYLSDKAIDVKISNIRRIHPMTTDIKAKITGNYVNSVMVSLEIHKQGYDEGLLLDTDWYIAEGPGENIFFVKNWQLYTPALGNLLPGITRDTIKNLYQELFTKEVIEDKINPEELDKFDEAFFVGTAAEVTPIWSITTEDWKKIQYKSWESGSITNSLKTLYLDTVSGENKSKLDWLY